MEANIKPAGYSITDLIPQRQPMIMIDELIRADERCAEGILFIKETNVFNENGVFMEAGLTEFIAQTAAAFTGFRQLIAKKEIKLGYIASVKNLVVYSLPAENTVIHSHITVENELLGYTIITGKVTQNEKVLAEIEMRILLDPES